MAARRHAGAAGRCWFGDWAEGKNEQRTCRLRLGQRKGSCAAVLDAPAHFGLRPCATRPSRLSGSLPGIMEGEKTEQGKGHGAKRTWQQQ